MSSNYEDKAHGNAQNAAAIRDLVMIGFTHESVVAAISTNDLSKLRVMGVGQQDSEPE